MDDLEIKMRAEYAVAAHFGYKPDPLAYARELIAREPQLWAYDEAQEQLKSDGFRVTQKRKDALWRHLGGK